MSKGMYEHVLSRLGASDGSVTKDLALTLKMMSNSRGPVNSEDFVVGITFGF